MAEPVRKDDQGPQPQSDAQIQRATLSICMRCRDGREDTQGEQRGGARLAAAVLRSAAKRPGLEIRGIHCMSQCKRPCVVAVSGPDRFTYFFGDLDPTRDADAVLALAQLYTDSPDGFMPRDMRPHPMRTGVIGRLPALGWSGDSVEITTLDTTTHWETPK